MENVEIQTVIEESEHFNQTTLERYKAILVERYKQMFSQPSAE